MQAAPGAGNGEGRAPLILLIEGDVDERAHHGAYLLSAGFRVAEAMTGIEAVERAAALLPDLILMDVSARDVGGCEAIRRLKSARQTGRIPILALATQTFEARQALEAGGDGVVGVSSPAVSLVARVRRLLRGGGARVRPGTC
ncbi:MAG: response regulator [Candidatus Rokubacteria bacterium]|nr:response regulator [Candidatus Rokubacteria bacterium]